MPGPVIGEGGKPAAQLAGHGKPLELRALDHLQKLLTPGARVIAHQAER